MAIQVVYKYFLLIIMNSKYLQDKNYHPYSKFFNFHKKLLFCYVSILTNIADKFSKYHKRSLETCMVFCWFWELCDFRVSLNLMTLQIDSPNVYTLQGVAVSMKGIAQVRSEVRYTGCMYLVIVFSFHISLSWAWPPPLHEFFPIIPVQLI